MKCPLFAIAWAGVVAQQAEYYPPCLREECAWWNNSSQQCYVGVMSGELYSLVEVMEEIRDKVGDLAKIESIRG